MRWSELLADVRVEYVSRREAKVLRLDLNEEMQTLTHGLFKVEHTFM